MLCQLVPDQQLQPWENNQVRNCHLRKATQEYISWQHQCCVATSFYRHCKMIETKWAVTSEFFHWLCWIHLLHNHVRYLKPKSKPGLETPVQNPDPETLSTFSPRDSFCGLGLPPPSVGKVVRRWLYPSIRIGCLAHLCALSWICGGQKPCSIGVWATIPQSKSSHRETNLKVENPSCANGDFRLPY